MNKPPKILILDDLHFEYEDGDEKLFPKIEDEYDIAILAGDISTRDRGVQWAMDYFQCPVVYVPGNHEFWSTNIINHRKKLQEITENSHIHVLDNREVIIHGIRFLGSTLWTDFSAWHDPHAASIAAGRGKHFYENGSKDFRKITSVGYRKLLPYEMIKMAQENKNWLLQKFLEPFDGPTIVVSHHPPSLKSLKQGKANDILDATDANDWDDVVIKSNAVAWIHGHTHHSNHYKIGNTEIISNPMGGLAFGKPFNPDFQYNKIWTPPMELTQNLKKANIYKP